MAVEELHTQAFRVELDRPVHVLHFDSCVDEAHGSFPRRPSSRLPLALRSARRMSASNPEHLEKGRTRARDGPASAVGDVQALAERCPGLLDDSRQLSCRADVRNRYEIPKPGLTRASRSS